jgi:predicted nucleotidyltransferase
MALYTPEERDEVAERLLDLLSADERVARAELSGSGAHGYDDRWSDVDLVVTVREGVDQLGVADDWIPRVYEALPVVHHFAVSFGEEHVRGFLLENLLEVDVGFRPAQVSEGDWPGPDADSEAGFAWHDVLHAAVALARGRRWRAQYYVGVLRWRTLALATARLGVQLDEYKDVDELPTELLRALEETLPRSLDPEELRRAVWAATSAFLDELRIARPELADRLTRPLEEFLTAAFGDTS